MIDAYKIEEATKDYINKNNYFAKYEEEPCVDIEFAYKAGAHWAINESLKDLWHPANEVPEIGRVIIMENYYPDGRIEFPSHWRKSTSHNPIDGNTQKWLYVDDLLPKEGGEQ